jgi:hypothetical protein
MFKMSYVLCGGRIGTYSTTTPCVPIEAFAIGQRKACIFYSGKYTEFIVKSNYVQIIFRVLPEMPSCCDENTSFDLQVDSTSYTAICILYSLYVPDSLIWDNERVSRECESTVFLMSQHYVISNLTWNQL